MGIILGLTAAFCWGGADFLARYSVRRIGAYRTLLFMQIFGFVGLTAYLELVRNPPWLAGTKAVWGWVVAAGLLNVVASLALYRAFEVGVLALVAPIAASYPALTVILARLSGERLAASRATGVFAALIGVVLAATPTTVPAPAAIGPQAGDPIRRRVRLPQGVGWALVAAGGFGFMFWLLGFRVTPAMGGVPPVWIFRGLTMVTLVLFARPVRQSIRLPRGSVWWLIAGCGLLDTAAFTATSIGLTTEQVSVVTVLSSLFGAVTIGLAWIFLRERLQRWQWIGIALIFAGIALVSRR